MSDGYFEILAPREWRVPAVFNSPHSGSFLPSELLHASKLTPRQLRRSEDCFVDELFMCCTDAGAPLLRALVSRAFIDFNREPYEFDPKLFADALPGHMNFCTPRVLSGLGTIPRIVAEGENIYRGHISLEGAVARIENIYHPYHRTLTGLVNQAHTSTGLVLLVDCHSMPHSSVATSGGQNAVDVVLGDRFGASCGPHYVEALEHYLTAEGLAVRLNRPYAGGFITETHGNPRQGRHAIQVEINRSLYMNEHSMNKNADFVALQKILARAVNGLISCLPDGQQAQQAAE
jgi:N-formylglutamate amidohydrolase